MNTLHPFLIPWLQKYNAAEAARRAAGVVLTPDNARADLAALFKGNVTSVPNIAMVRDEYIPAPAYAAPVRVYHPRPGRALPVLVYFHGGGYVAGSISVYEPMCRKLAQASDHIVVCPEYRLAPEAPYPAAVIDAQAALAHLPELLRSLNILYQPVFSVAGDSSGAGLALIAALRARRANTLTVRRQVLITPLLDFTLSTPSMERYGTGLLVEKAMTAWCLDQYLQHDEDRKALSPLFWEYGPGLAETLVVTAEFSPTRDEGTRFAERLQQSGVRVEHLHFDDMIHGFLGLENLVPDACRKLYEAVGMFLQG